MSLHCVGTFLAALLITPAFLAVILDSHVTDAGCPRRANRNGKANRALRRILTRSNQNL